MEAQWLGLPMVDRFAREGKTSGWQHIGKLPQWALSYHTGCHLWHGSLIHSSWHAHSCCTLDVVPGVVGHLFVDAEVEAQHPEGVEDEVLKLVCVQEQAAVAAEEEAVHALAGAV